MADGAVLITHNNVLGMDYRCPEEPIFSVLRRDLGGSGDAPVQTSWSVSQLFRTVICVFLQRLY